MTDNEVKLDLEREKRMGLEEAIFCPRKSNDQIEVILERIEQERRSCLLTRLSPAQYAAIAARYRALIDYDEVSATAYFRWQPRPARDPEIAVMTAGSSDVPVAREALRTLGYFHVNALPIFDVGVAGLWRLLERVEEIQSLPVVIVVAGMDAALPSVVGGLFRGLIVAVPTSVGYGVASGGHTALNSILASCASGLVTVNIDNGYGAACAALRVLSPARNATARIQHSGSERVDTPSQS